MRDLVSFFHMWATSFSKNIDGGDNLLSMYVLGTISIIIWDAGERAQQLGAEASLPEGQSQILNTHMVAHSRL